MEEETLLQQALSRYGLGNAKTKLLQRLWHHVYFVESDDLKRFNLRICAATYQDKAILADELAWLDYVTRSGRISVAHPVANELGELLTTISTGEGERFCCLFAWIEGEAANQCIAPPVMYEIGRSVATLHALSREFAFPSRNNGFRRNYCYDRTLAESHREWVELHQGEIGVANTKLLQSAIDWLLLRFEEIGETPENYGFIHADLHLGNFIVQEGQVSVIDFDQLGRGHYAYDIACLMVELQDDSEQFATRWDSFKRGYQSIGELPFRQESELEMFVVAVQLAFLDWVYNSSEPAVRELKMPSVNATLDSIQKHIAVN